jgi:hypothetical protein
VFLEAGVGLVHRILGCTWKLFAHRQRPCRQRKLNTN